MRVLGIIPARGGSKGVPGKNTRPLGGKPLIAYAALSAKQSTLLSAVIVTTNSEDIATIARACGADVPFIRPSHLAQDDTPTLPVIQHAVNWFEQTGVLFDAVCLLQPTYPFRTPGFMDACIEKFRAESADTLISVIPVPHQFNPHWVFEKDDSGFLKIATGESTIIPQRQQLPEAFIRDGNIYIVSTEVLMQQNTLYGKNISYQVSDAAWYVNIDTPADWAIAEEKAGSYQKAFLPA